MLCFGCLHFLLSLAKLEPSQRPPCRSFAYYDTESGVLDSVDDERLDVAHMRKTKIVATIGPTSNTLDAIIEMGDKGLNVARCDQLLGVVHRRTSWY